MAKKVNIQAPAPQEINEGATAALAGAPKKKKDTRIQLGIKISPELYDDLQIIEQIHKGRGESWTTTKLVNGLLVDYVEDHRAEITKYKQLIQSLEQLKD